MQSQNSGWLCRRSSPIIRLFLVNLQLRLIQIDEAKSNCQAKDNWLGAKQNLVAQRHASQPSDSVAPRDDLGSCFRFLRLWWCRHYIDRAFSADCVQCGCSKEGGVGCGCREEGAAPQWCVRRWDEYKYKYIPYVARRQWHNDSTWNLRQVISAHSLIVSISGCFKTVRRTSTGSWNQDGTKIERR